MRKVKTLLYFLCNPQFYASFLMLTTLMLSTLLCSASIQAQTLSNGGVVRGEIASVGDIDTYTLSASQGDYVFISVVDINQTNLSALITLTDSNGTVITNGQGSTVSKVSMTTPSSGEYTLTIRDNNSSGSNDTGVGLYDIHYVRVPDANEHGALTSGGIVSETLTLGDIDTWTLDVNEGDYAFISLADLGFTSLSVFLDLYDPDGVRITAGQGSSVSKVSMTAAKTGTYTLVVSDNNSSSVNDTGVGDYDIHYVRVPDANEHGLLSGVGQTTETITLGDIDSYTFSGEVGAEVTFVITDVNSTNLSIFFAIYDAAGNRLTQVQDNQQAVLSNYQLLSEGIHTLVIVDNNSSSVNDTGVGDYIIEYELPELIDPPQAPIASISAPASVVRGELISLDGGNSIDPDMGPDPLSYSWTLVSVPSGSSLTQANLNDDQNVVANIIPDALGQYVFELEVFDGSLSGTAQTTVIVENQRPVAEAGSDQNALNGDAVNLDGTASFDDDQDTLTYQWQITEQPEGSNVVLSSATSAMPSFVPQVDGVYVLSLTVSDGFVNSLPDTVTITVSTANTPPNAIASASGILLVGEVITLDASQSFDDDEGPQALTYTWQSIGENSAQIDDPQAAVTSFIANMAGSYTLQLTVSDGEATDTTTISIVIEDLPVNIVPIADAGEDINIDLGEVALLDGSASLDPDNGPQAMSYEWRFVSTPEGSQLAAGSINGANSEISSFEPDVAGVYVVSLTVFDGLLSHTDTVNIIVDAVNIRPVANAGDDQAVSFSALVMLSGSESFDADAGPLPLSYQWGFLSLPGGSQLIDLDLNVTGSEASFLPDVPGTYELILTVSDGDLESQDTVSIVVEAPVVARCDVDRNGVIDFLDISSIFMMRGATASGPDDPADWDEDGVITVLDARGCVLSCDLNRCATPE